MVLEEFTLLHCDEGHRFYIPVDQMLNEDGEEISLDDIQCPICSTYVSDEASRTVLIATSGKDADRLFEIYDGGDK